MQQIISPHFIAIINRYNLTFENDRQHTTLWLFIQMAYERKKSRGNVFMKWYKRRLWLYYKFVVTHFFGIKNKTEQKSSEFHGWRNFSGKVHCSKVSSPYFISCPTTEWLMELWWATLMLVFCIKKVLSRTKILHWQNEIWSILRARIAGSWWRKFTFLKQVKEIVDTWKKLCVVKLQKCHWTKPLILIVSLRI